MQAVKPNAGSRRRRFWSRGLPAAAAVCGMLWAVSAGAYQPPTKTDPKTEVKGDETYEFAMSGKPWKDVLGWINEKTGMPIVGVAIPSGTFTLLAPNGKKYTMSEVLDLINAGLLANDDSNKYLLIRRQREFVLVAADQKDKIANLADLVKLEDLHKYGKSMYVCVIVPLKKLVNEEAKDDYAKSLSIFGTITAIKPNSLKITDQVSTIDRILEMVKQAEAEADKGAESYSHTCKYVRASEVERQLRELLPDPEKIAKFGSSTTTAPQPMGDPRFTDPRFQPRQPTVALPKAKIYQISSNDIQNTIIVTGPADILAKAQELIEKKIDVGSGKRGPVILGDPMFTTYQLGGGNAEAWANDLRKIFPESSTLRISPVGNNAIRVYGTPQVHEEIQAKLGLYQGITSRKIPCGNLDCNSVADMLVKWLGDAPKTGAPNIQAMPDDNTILVRGNKDQIDEVEAIVKAGNGSGVQGLGTDNMRILTLGKGSGVSVAEEIARIMNKLNPGTVKVLGIGGEDTQPREREMEKAPEFRKPKDMEKVPEDQSRLDGDDTHFVKYQPAIVDPKQTRAPAAPSVTITASGNKIIITSTDPAALAAAVALFKLITQTQAGEGDFQVIKLNYAPADAAAKELDEVFNGKPQQGGGGGGRRGGGGAFFQQGAAPAAPATPAPDAVRVVADMNSNSLIVRASPVDMLTIRRMLREHIDNPAVNTATTMKTWTITPKYLSANEVVNWLQQVYKEQTGNSARTAQVGNTGGFNFGGFGRGGNQNTTTTTTPQVALSIGVEEQTNTLVLMCNETMYKSVKELVTLMDDRAKDHQRTVKVESLQGVDATTLQNALAIFGNNRTTMNRTSPMGQTGGPTSGGPGGNQGGGQNFFPVGGNLPQGSSPGFLGNPGRVTPGGFIPSGGPGGGFPGGGFPGGNPNGGGGGMRRGGPTGMITPSGSPGGLGFFVQRVKDDPEPFDLFFDPHHDYPVEQYVASGSIPVGNNAGREPSVILQVGSEEQQQPPVMPPAEPQAQAIVGPRGPIDVTAIPELDIVIIRGMNPEDVAEILKVIQKLQEHARDAQVAVELVRLQNGDATAVAAFLSQLYSRVLLTPSGNAPYLLAPRTTTTQGAFASLTQTIQQPSSVGLIPMPRFNSILVAAPKSQMKYVLEEIKRLDVQNALPLVPFHLEKAASSRVATLIANFWNQRYPGEGNSGHQLRVFAEDYQNTVWVQAAPADMLEIEKLIRDIDLGMPKTVSDIKIVTLNNALADDLTTVLQQAIAAAIITPTVTPSAPPGGTGAGAAPAAPAAPRLPATTGTPNNPGVATRNSTITFVSPFGTVKASLLEDIHLTSYPTTNSIIIMAPEQSMELLLRLIATLDVPPKAKAVVKVYPLKNGDAATMATMIQQFYLGTGPSAPTPAAPGSTTGPRTTGTTGTTGTTTPAPIQIMFPGGTTPEGAPLIPVRLTVDERTNSIIYAGSENDVRIIETLLARLDGTGPEPRRAEVYCLQTGTATDVANALNNYITAFLGAEQLRNNLTPYQVGLLNVVVVPEPITNKLLISATPRMMPEVMRMLHELDVEPPQVMIQVMICEVDLTGTEEFGVEFGLQNPVLFNRGVIPNPGTISLSNATGGLVPPGVTVNSTIAGVAQPGFNYLGAPATSIASNNSFQPAVVGAQGITDLGVGRVSPTSGIGGFVFSLQSDTINLLVRALKTQGRVDILNGTNVTTVDNQSAGILVGQSVPYITGSNVSSLGTVTNTIAYRNVGVQLTVTPKINPDGRVLMRVLPEVSKVSATTINIGNNTTASAFDVQNVETTVLAQDGETLVIGGLISKNDTKNENKVPWLGDLPGIGAMFRFRTQTKARQELIVILTPHVIRNHADVQKLLCAETNKMNWCRNDVERAHGPLGLEDCPGHGGACGGVDGAVPAHQVLPGAMQISPTPELVPAPRSVKPEVVAPPAPVMAPMPPQTLKPVPAPAARTTPPPAPMVIPASTTSSVTETLPPLSPGAASAASDDRR